MTAASIVGALLAEHAPLTAVVPAAQTKAGKLPDGVPLPALLVRVVSLVDRQALKQAGPFRSTARVAVTVRAASYRQQGEIIKLVRAACVRDFVAEIAGARRVSIRTNGLGPDLIGPGNSFEQTQDFRVTFDAAV